MMGSSRLGWRPVAALLVAGLAVAPAAPASDGVDPVGEEQCVGELVLAFEALEAGDGQSALDHYRTALAMAVSETLRFQALLGLGSTWAAVGEPDKAVDALEHARDLQPENAEVWYTLGTVYAAAGRMADVLEALAEAGRLAPRLAAAHYDRCVLLAGLGRHAEAAGDCGAATAAEPSLVEAWVGLGVARYHLAAYPEATDAFRHALDLEPDNARAHLGLGLALLYADDTRGAKEQYLALKKIDADLAQQLYDRICP